MHKFSVYPRLDFLCAKGRLQKWRGEIINVSKLQITLGFGPEISSIMESHGKEPAKRKGRGRKDDKSTFIRQVGLFVRAEQI